MRTLKRRDLESAMKKKGFEEVKTRSTNHTAYQLQRTTPGKTRVKTVLSRGGHGREISQPLLGKVMGQIGFGDGDEELFADYIECRFERGPYEDMLRAKNLLSVRGRRSRR